MIKSQEVIIIDYGMGNILSVVNALNFLGYRTLVTDNVKSIAKSKHIILPGVGNFKEAMNILVKKNIDLAIKENIKNQNGKILGICLGMQLLAKTGHEGGGEISGIGLIDGKVKKFQIDKENNYKIPHVGFNEVNFSKDSTLYRGLKNKNYFYFVHSYKLLSSQNTKDYTFAYCNHGEKFIASFESKNVFGTQFHPEKSQKNGLTLLKNFLEN